MNRFSQVIAGVIALLVLLAPPTAVAEDAPFRRGVSLQAFTFPAVVGGRYADDPYPDASATASRFAIAGLRGIGIDHVRLPVEVGPLLDDRSGTVRRRLVATLRDVIARLQAARLGVILTLVAPGLGGALPENQLDGPEGPKFKRYLAVAETLAGAVSNLDRAPLGIEPMNEPQRACVRTDGPDWAVHQPLLLARLRAAAPRLWLGVTGGCWSKIEGLGSIDAAVLRDPRTFLSIHYYDPFLFTHQGTDWTLDIMPLVSGLPYPPQPDALPDVLAAARARADRMPVSAGSPPRLARAEEAIRYYFSTDPAAARRDAVADLQRRTAALGIAPGRVVFTEFGATRTPDADRSRARWLKDVSDAIGGMGWGWTLWVLREGPFGLDGRDGRLDAALLAALGLRPPRSTVP